MFAERLNILNSYSNRDVSGERAVQVSGYIVRLSGGITSYVAALRTAERYGRDRVRMVFADVIIEDEDSYRFLIQGAADIARVPMCRVESLAARALALPLVEDGRMAERKVALKQLAIDTMAVIPSLHWIADGRDPWEVFRDERFIGNSRIAPCSKILKQELLDRWTTENCGPDDIHIFGLDFDEQGRQERLTARIAPLRCEFPLNDSPVVYKEQHLGVARLRGIEPPRMYAAGFPHGNCGGRCVRGGQAAFANLLNWNPVRYALTERAEQNMQVFLGRDDVSILSHRRGGAKKPLSLRILRERIQGAKLFDEGDWGACSCFSVEEDLSRAVTPECAAQAMRDYADDPASVATIAADGILDAMDADSIAARVAQDDAGDAMGVRERPDAFDVV